MNNSSSSSTSEVDIAAIDLSNRSANIVHQMRMVATKVENAIAGNDSLRQFGDAILKYKDLFLENMKKCVTNFSKNSQENVELIVSIAENHWLVQPNRLERWIGFKEAELVMFEWMTQVEGVTSLENENQLKEKLSSLVNEFAIVLFIPSLDQWSRKITEELKNADPFTTPSQLPLEDPEPWHLNEETRKSAFDKICILAQHAKSDTSEQWKFFIAFEDKVESCGHFSIYKREIVMKSNLKELPVSLDELKAQPTAVTAPEIVPSQQGEPGCIVPDDFVEIAPSETTAGDGIVEDDGENCGHFTIYKQKKVLKSNLKNLQMQRSAPKRISSSSKNIRQETAPFKPTAEMRKKVKLLPERIDLPAGELATNCKKCKMTCARYTEKVKETPSSAYCSECPGKCSWKQHSFNSSFFEWNQPDERPPLRSAAKDLKP